MKSLFILLFLYTTTLSATCETPRSPQVVGKISSNKLKEVSGIDFSRKNPNLFWAITDSGTEDILYGLDLSGNTLVELKVAGAKNIDWEDISLAKCLHNKNLDCIYIADTGNNKRNRNEFQIYVLEEPSSLTGKKISVAQVINFKVKGDYNFEAFVVNEKTSEMMIFSKSDKNETNKNTSTVFTLTSSAQEAKKVAEIDFKKFPTTLAKEDMIVTSADYDSASEELLIGTNGDAFSIKWKDLNSFNSKAKLLDMPKQEQAEAISWYYSMGQKSIVTTSEGANSSIFNISCY